MRDYSVRPTKKQLLLLEFIEQFISEHGYSPSYREIMNGCNYTSVATVALHINSLIARGHLVKRGRSARSLELTHAHTAVPKTVYSITEAESKWFIDVVDTMFNDVESTKKPTQRQIDELYVLVGALKVMNLTEAATSFIPRLKALRETLVKRPK